MLTGLLQRFKRSSYWKDIAWVISGNVAANLLAVIALPLLTRLYVPADFAVQALFIQLMGLVAIIITCRYEVLIQLPKQDVGARSLVALVVALSVVGVAALTGPLWAWRNEISALLGDERLAPWLVLVPLTAALLSWAVAVQSYLQRQQRYRMASMSELASKGMYVTTAISGFWLLAAPAGLIIAQATASIAKLIYLLLPRSGQIGSASAQTRQWPTLSQIFARLRGVAAAHRSLAAGLAVSNVLQAITLLLPSAYILRNYGADVLGQFALVMATIYLPSGLIGKAIGKVYYQRAAQIRATGRNSLNLWNSTAARVLFLGLPIYVALFALAQTLYPLIFGATWAMAGRFAQAMSVAGFFSFVTSPFGNSSLTVGVWWYPIAWSTLRLCMTACAIGVAWNFSLDAAGFVMWLAAAHSSIYIVDGIAQRHFSAMNAVGASTT